METNSNYQQIKSEQNLDEEIDLINLISFFLRNKILIGTLASLSFFIACLYSLTLKRVWEGQFQIVLNSDQNSKITSFSPTFINLIGSDQGNNNLKTQVGILQSPSVLMPIYDFVNSKDSKDKINQLPFDKWKKNNLDVELQKGTSILNIAYRDKNKEIILPVLKKMSSIYQDYSQKGLRREQQLSKEYLINQISVFREKSANSLKSAQNYAIDQNMIYLGNEEFPDISSSIPEENSQGKLREFDPEFLGSIVNIENVRVAAANKIRKINLQIKKINELDPRDYENLQYFGSTIEALNQEGLPQTLKNIERDLVILRTKYTEKDSSIIRLLEQRKLTVDLLKSRALKYLKIARLEAEATMEAAMRPKDVLLKYRELRRDAGRDERTLFALEKDLRILELQQAKINDPWQLITQPTLLNNPVAPSRKQIGLIGLVIGSIIGMLASFYKEKKSDNIFTLQQLQKLLYKSCLERIDTNEKFGESKEIMFFKEFLNNQNAKKIAFITLEENNRTYLKGLRSYLTDETDLNTEIEIISNQYSLEECKSADFTILFTSLVHSSFKEIKSLKSRFDFLDVPFKGFVLLS